MAAAGWLVGNSTVSTVGVGLAFWQATIETIRIRTTSKRTARLLMLHSNL
jgi:hypothetical protein